MKVGLIIYGSLDTVSGGYLYDRKLVQYLRQQRDEVVVFSLPWLSYGRQLTQNFWHHFAQQIVQAELDILLQDELNHPSLFLRNRWLKRQIAYPLISIVHHLRSSERHPLGLLWVYKLIERSYLRSVDGFIFNSQTTQQVVTELVGSRPSVVAAPGGDRFQAHLTKADITGRAQSPGPLRLLFVGNVIPRKGLHTLLTAVAHLPCDKWRLDIVGDITIAPAYVRQLQEQINQSRCAENVVWHGRVPDEVLVDNMANSHLLVVPSQYEGFGIVYLEGMGFGLPAIGTRHGAASEIIDDGVNGFLITTENSTQLSEHIQQLHENRTYLDVLSQQALQTYHEKCGWVDGHRAIRRFLQELI